MPHSPRTPALIALAVVAVVVAATGVGMLIGRALSDESAAQSDVVAPTPIPRDPSVVFMSLPSGYRIESLITGLEGAAALDGAPDGRIFVVEQFTGRVRVIEEGRLREEPYYTVPDVYVQGDGGFVSELGLVGVTVDPRADDGTFVYVYYSAVSTDGHRSTKLVRLRDENGFGVDPHTVLEIDAASECCHIAGSLVWLPDRTLLVGVGDHETAEAAQDLASPQGKLLRINPDGSAPADNPFPTRDGADPRVFAYGLRNPFGVGVDADGAMFVLDNGEFGYDTVYELHEGANYGWPSSVVPAGAAVEEPLHTYLESTGLAGAIVYDAGPLAELDGKLLFCQFHRGGALHRFNPERIQFEVDDAVLSTSCSSGIRQLADGYVYFLDYVNGSLLRLVDEAAPPFAPKP